MVGWWTWWMMIETHHPGTPFVSYFLRRQLGTPKNPATILPLKIRAWHLAFQVSLLFSKKRWNSTPKPSFKERGGHFFWDFHGDQKHISCNSQIVGKSTVGDFAVSPSPCVELGWWVLRISTDQNLASRRSVLQKPWPSSKVLRVKKELGKKFSFASKKWLLKEIGACYFPSSYM